jgi:hypothetical protein
MMIKLFLIFFPDRNILNCGYNGYYLSVSNLFYYLFFPVKVFMLAVLLSLRKEGLLCLPVTVDFEVEFFQRERILTTVPPEIARVF